MLSLRRISLLLALAAAPGLSSCAAIVAIAGVKAGTTVAQDRSVGQAIDDATINTQLNAQLAGQSFDLFRNVGTKVVSGRVLLTGHVANDNARIEAEHIARGIDGVRDVADEIVVDKGRGIGTYLNDVRISDQLRAKLVTDGKIAWVNYNVETVSGTVYLMGIAQDQAELDRVALHARTIGGVKKVVSYVALKGEATRQASLD